VTTSELNVNPADLVRFANTYEGLAAQARLISPQAAAEAQRIADTHGPIGAPAAMGIAAGLSKVDGPLNAKAADFQQYSQRFNEHAATYTGQDGEGARGYKQTDRQIGDGLYRRTRPDGAGGNTNGGVRAVDDREPKTPTPPGKPMVPGPLQPGRPPDPADPFVGDPRFGHWEAVPPAPPYTGGTPPPLQPQFRPYPDGTPLKVGPTTGMYTPGKTWIGDIDPPAVQGQEGYRFKLAGEEATTMTRTVFDDGRWQQQRWVQNVYDYERNTATVFGGDIGLKGIDGESGDLGGIPPIQNIDHTWKPISLPQIATLSAGNADTTYYLPDGCGGSVPFVGGVAQGSSGLPPRPPVMTAPR
jgi:Excreted virulence factor EspC, type VII ESX diderm